MWSSYLSGTVAKDVMENDYFLRKSCYFSRTIYRVIFKNVCCVQVIKLYLVVYKAINCIKRNMRFQHFWFLTDFVKCLNHCLVLFKLKIKIM